jgi:hypothetical protein
MSSPSTNVRLSRLLWWVLRGSEKEPEGGERKGGGKGLGGLLAKSASPVSNRKGGTSPCAGGISSPGAVDVVERARHSGELWVRERGGWETMERASVARRTDLLIPASWGEHGEMGTTAGER